MHHKVTWSTCSIVFYNFTTVTYSVIFFPIYQNDHKYNFIAFIHFIVTELVMAHISKRT